jgi:type II secretory pathway component PulC
MDRASVDRYLANLPDLLNSATATPRYRDMPDGRRAIDGFEIGQIRKASVVEQLGLQEGDVILEVNGQALDGLATVMKLFGEFQAAPQATVTILRNGRRMTIVFRTK